MPSSAVEAVDVGKSYGGVAALTAASFTAIAGEVHALVGENGMIMKGEKGRDDE